MNMKEQENRAEFFRQECVRAHEEARKMMHERDDALLKAKTWRVHAEVWKLVAVGELDPVFDEFEVKEAVDYIWIEFLMRPGERLPVGVAAHLKQWCAVVIEKVPLLDNQLPEFLLNEWQYMPEQEITIEALEGKKQSIDLDADEPIHELSDFLYWQDNESYIVTLEARTK